MLLRESLESSEVMNEIQHFHSQRIVWIPNFAEQTATAKQFV